MDFEVDQAALAHVRETLWDNFWTQGGFGMYPTAFWGFLLLLYAGLYFLRPQERFLRAVAILAFMTLASGALGTAIGVIIALRYAATVAPELAARSACYGSAMSLHVVVLALMLVILGGMITGAGKPAPGAAARHRVAMPSDETLYLQLVGGDMAAFDELYRRYERRLFAYIVRQLGDRSEAEDVYHEAFMAVLKERRSGRELSSFKAWIFQVARNLCRNRQRARDRSRRAVDKESGALASSPPAEQLFAEREAPLALQRAAMQLPEPMADLYRLRTAGLSYDEIAEALDIPLGTVKSRMKAMLGRLREEMDKCTAK